MSHERDGDTLLKEAESHLSDLLRIVEKMRDLVDEAYEAGEESGREESE